MIMVTPPGADEDVPRPPSWATLAEAYPPLDVCIVGGVKGTTLTVGDMHGSMDPVNQRRLVEFGLPCRKDHNRPSIHSRVPAI